MLLPFIASAHGSFMMQLEANFISAIEVRQRETAGSGMQSPILIQIALLPQIEHGLLESTSSLGCVTTLKENSRYLQHFMLLNYDHKIPDKLPVGALVGFKLPVLYYSFCKFCKSRYLILCIQIHGYLGCLQPPPSHLVLQYQEIWHLLQHGNPHSYMVPGSKSYLSVSHPLSTTAHSCHSSLKTVHLQCFWVITVFSFLPIKDSLLTRLARHLQVQPSLKKQ